MLDTDLMRRLGADLPIIQAPLAAARMLGAHAVQMGTAFLTCPESGVAACYRDAILAAQETDTRITRAFSGRLARAEPAAALVTRVAREAAAALSR